MPQKALTHHDHCPWCFLMFLGHSLHVYKQNSNKVVIRFIKISTAIRVLEHTFRNRCKFLKEV